MDERRVVGQGYSVLASSLDQCLALCNKDPGNCDGVNYRKTKNKCRLLARCANTTVLPDTQGFLYYSKRPRVVSEGFKYEPTSDSCLKVIRKLVDYADADRMCAHQNGRLVALTTVAVNTMATSLLRLSGAQYAWIGLQDKAVEGDPTHSDGKECDLPERVVVPSRRTALEERQDQELLGSSGRWTLGRVIVQEPYPLHHLFQFLESSAKKLNMPLFGKKENKCVDYKARLEHKLYLAREDPEPVFDLSDCALKSVPAGIYSLCKVFRKDALYLQENQLRSLAGGGSLQDLSLLQVLDIHSNNLIFLPEDITLLRSLRILNVSSNNLKSLPEALGSLQKLRVLNVSFNNLRAIPSSMGKLCYLHTLDLRGNTFLNTLPNNLCQATGLRDLMVDPTGFVHPPTSVVQMGTVEVIKFLCSELGVRYVSPCESPEEGAFASNSSCKANSLDADDKEKVFQEQRQLERIALEKELEEHHRRELELQHGVRANKNRVVELTADTVISQLLALSEISRDSSQLQHLLEQEFKEEERLLNMRQEEYQSLRRKEVLNGMEALLEEECRREAKLREYEEGRAEATRTLLSQEVETDKQLATLLLSQGQAQSELVGRLQKDEELQRAAVAALLERGDARSWALVHQVAVVESQLASLTALEMERKKLEMNEQIVRYTEKGEKSDEDFWLLQYQRLLDSRPYSLVEMERSLDPMLAQHLVVYGAIHCLPFLAQWAGVTLAQDRAAILEAVNSFLEQLAAPEDSGASAPTLEAEGTMNVAECAVCLDDTCEVIFVPCGHMCCCIKCAELVGQCPLCRADINQKVRVIQP
uniref:RING-type domain-containing protein n=1 Tax=Timema tahoe TaxID=61484 RepID=A0A7R9FHX7_9NEOP|nr:unnamed protein product [Timema tahoe]